MRKTSLKIRDNITYQTRPETNSCPSFPNPNSILSHNHGYLLTPPQHHNMKFIQEHFLPQQTLQTTTTHHTRNDRGPVPNLTQRIRKRRTRTLDRRTDNLPETHKLELFERYPEHLVPDGSSQGVSIPCLNWRYGGATT